MTGREKKFCSLFLGSGNSELAAEKAGYTGDCEQKGEELICRPEISAELERLSRLREKSLANMAAAGYQRLAFGSICDAISLLYKSDPSKEDLEGMDLFLVSEIKRPKDGSMEIKFFDRLKALEKLGASLENTVIIEDSENGVKAAKECNVTCIGFSSPDAVKPQNLYKADVLIESFDSIDKTFIENTLLRSHGKPITIASTKRLIIRELAVSDIPQIYTIYSDPQVRKYIDNIDDYLDAEMEKQKAYIQKVYSFYGYGLWGVFGKTSKKLIGRCGFENETIDGKDEIMLSYLLDSEHWGYGYALECCEAALRYAKENLDMNRIVVVIDHDNSRSIKTAEKLGFKYEKDVVFNDKDRILFSIQL